MTNTATLNTLNKNTDKTQREKMKVFIYEGKACMLIYIEPSPKLGATLDLIIHVYIF